MSNLRSALSQLGDAMPQLRLPTNFSAIKSRVWLLLAVTLTFALLQSRSLWIYLNGIRVFWTAVLIFYALTGIWCIARNGMVSVVKNGAMSFKQYTGLISSVLDSLPLLVMCLTGDSSYMINALLIGHLASDIWMRLPGRLHAEVVRMVSQRRRPPLVDLLIHLGMSVWVYVISRKALASIKGTLSEANKLLDQSETYCSLWILLTIVYTILRGLDYGLHGPTNEQVCVNGSWTLGTTLFAFPTQDDDVPNMSQPPTDEVQQAPEQSKSRMSITLTVLMALVTLICFLETSQYIVKSRQDFGNSNRRSSLRFYCFLGMAIVVVQRSLAAENAKDMKIEAATLNPVLKTWGVAYITSEINRFKGEPISSLTDIYETMMLYTLSCFAMRAAFSLSDLQCYAIVAKLRSSSVQCYIEAISWFTKAFPQAESWFPQARFWLAQAESWFAQAKSWFAQARSWFAQARSWFAQVGSWFPNGGSWSRAVSRFPEAVSRWFPTHSHSN